LRIGLRKTHLPPRWSRRFLAMLGTAPSQGFDFTNDCASAPDQPAERCCRRGDDLLGERPPRAAHRSHRRARRLFSAAVAPGALAGERSKPGLQIIITFQRGPTRHCGSDNLRCALSPIPSPGSLVGVQTAREAGRPRGSGLNSSPPLYTTHLADVGDALLGFRLASGLGLRRKR
jgi:hypothetical protein